MSLKYSRQRQAIWDFLQTRTDHPTADTVYVNVRKSFPNISLGTVYRNLMLLKDIGKLQTLDVGDGLIHFDPHIEPHDHFVCRSCGKIRDLQGSCGSDVIAAVREETHGEIDECRSFFYGLCSDCLKTVTAVNNEGTAQKL